MGAKKILSHIDAFQQRHAVLAFPIAVFRKFSEDQATNLAALVAYWAFFSLFPLLLVAVTILGFLHIHGPVVRDTLGQFPIIGQSFADPNHPQLGGSGIGLIVGLVTALWSGLGVVKTAQTAFNAVWEVPMVDRPKFVEKLLRAAKALVVLGIGVLITLGLTTLVTGGADIHDTLPLWARIGLAVIAIALDVMLFAVAFMWLTDRDLSMRDVLPGAVFAGVIWFFLQMFGTALITHQAHGQKGAYGTFAVVLGLLWWFYVQAQITLLGMEMNVVRKERLWPRGLVDAPDTPADHRAYTAYAEERTYRPNQDVRTSFDPADEGRPTGAPTGTGRAAGAQRGGWRAR